MNNQVLLLTSNWTNNLRKLILLAGFTTIVLLISQTAYSVGFEVIAPHRAVYDIKLNKASERSGISNLSGRIVYEIHGNECEGVTIKYRFVNRVSTPRKSFITDQRTSTYESADGENFTFLTKSYLNDQLERTVRGNAKQGSESVEINLLGAQPRSIKVQKAKFLSTYIMDLVTRAKLNEQFVRGDIFDGSGDGEDAVATSTVIGTAKILDKKFDGEGDSIGDQLSGLPAWPVSMSYFKKDVGATAEHLPVYESSFLLYENGITRKLIMRYPDYSLKGHLVELELFDKQLCQKDG